MPRRFKLGTLRKQKKQQQVTPSPEPESLIVSLPLAAFTNSPLLNTESLQNRLEAVGGLPSGKNNMHAIRILDEVSLHRCFIFFRVDLSMHERVPVLFQD